MAFNFWRKRETPPAPDPIILHIEPEVGDTELRIRVSHTVHLAAQRVDPQAPSNRYNPGGF